MLLVKTYTKSSPIHGIGLFADEDIPKGTVVWEWTFGIDIVITKEKMESLTEIQMTYLKTYAWLDSSGNRWLCSDDTRFANHSETPSCISQVIDGKWIDFAIEDIKKGDEITYNYRDFHKGDDL